MERLFRFGAIGILAATLLGLQFEPLSAGPRPQFIFFVD